jgi:hypothetical protein
VALLGAGCGKTKAGASGQGGSGGATDNDGGGGADADAAPPVTISHPWDWAGIIGTGQSLAVGQMGIPVKATTQPYNNLKMSSGKVAWPLDPNDPMLAMVPLIEPIGRPSTTYPSSYPTNIAGETPHAAMGNQITAMVMAASGEDYVNVHGEFGENGQCITFLKKGAVPNGVNGRAYQATILETTAITRLAGLANKTYGVGALIITHGECDAGNANYENDLFQLISNYNTDIPPITGQTQPLLMITSQQNSSADRSASTLAQWRVGVDHSDVAVCSGPKYQYPYAADHTHLVTDGYEQLGEKYAQVYFERVVAGHDWQPLQPTAVDRSGRVITVHFHVPVPPLVWDDLMPPPGPAVPAWSMGKGFEVRAGGATVGAGGTPVAISGVEIVDDTVQITCASDLPATGVVVGYAMTISDASGAQVHDASGNLLWAGTVRWGQLRDSDPFVGAMTNRAQPNYSVAFEMTVP